MRKLIHPESIESLLAIIREKETAIFYFERNTPYEEKNSFPYAQYSYLLKAIPRFNKYSISKLTRKSAICKRLKTHIEYLDTLVAKIALISPELLVQKDTQL